MYIQVDWSRHWLICSDRGTAVALATAAAEGWQDDRWSRHNRCPRRCLAVRRWPSGHHHLARGLDRFGCCGPYGDGGGGSDISRMKRRRTWCACASPDAPIHPSVRLSVGPFLSAPFHNTGTTVSRAAAGSRVLVRHRLRAVATLRPAAVRRRRASRRVSSSPPLSSSSSSSFSLSCASRSISASRSAWETGRKTGRREERHAALRLTHVVSHILHAGPVHLARG